jgi:hypothetical protein
VIGLRIAVVMVLAGGVDFPKGRSAPDRPAALESHPAVSKATTAAVGRGISVLWKQSGEGGRFLVEVAGLDPQILAVLEKPEMTPDLWASILPIRVTPDRAGGGNEATSLWGRYRLERDTITFEPRFPLEPGIRYSAELDLATLWEVARKLAPGTHFATAKASPADVLVAEFTMPRKSAGPAAAVVAVYPSADVLPENLLRFYVHFSAPMSRGEAYRRIRLLDAAGKPVEAAFLELDEELWSGDGTRFTLVFDPGRVKKGLKPREELGPILMAGRSYSLVIDREWHDASGSSLGGEFRKQFRAGPADDTSPDPKAWNIQPPKPDGREPLQVTFPESLDRALLDRLIVVQDARGNDVRGHVAVAHSETRWSFTPEGPWRPGEYHLAVAKELEDVAGNSVASPFEVDVSRAISARITTDTVVLKFRIANSSQSRATK